MEGVEPAGPCAPSLSPPPPRSTLRSVILAPQPGPQPLHFTGRIQITVGSATFSSGMVARELDTRQRVRSVVPPALF